MQTMGRSNCRKGGFLRFYRLCDNFYMAEATAPHRAQPLDAERGLPYERHILFLTENLADEFLSSANTHRRA